MAGWSADLGFFGYLAAAELVAAFSAWSEKALESHSRAGLLEAAHARGTPERAQHLLSHLPSYLLSARILRFLGKAALVIGLASLMLGDSLLEGGACSGSLVPVPWASLAWMLALAFVINFVVNDVLVGVAARRAPDRFLVRALPGLDLLRVLSAPLRIPLVALVRVLFRVSLEQTSPGTREEVRESVTEGQREGALSSAEAEMIESIIDLPRTTAADVLIPRSQVSMLPADTTLAEAVAFVKEDGHSRVPVYGKDRDDVLGVLNARDLLAHAGSAEAAHLTVRHVLRPPYFVPESKPLHALLDEMRARKVHLAVVLNELGATSGVVTIEDLLEQIVGDIHDEYDVEERRAPRPEDLPRGEILLDAQTSVEEANRTLRLSLPIESDYDTLGGLLLHRLGKVPQTGERLTLDGVTLTVAEADERRVKRVRVDLASARPPSGSDPRPDKGGAGGG